MVSERDCLADCLTNVFTYSQCPADQIIYPLSLPIYSTYSEQAKILIRDQFAPLLSITLCGQLFRHENNSDLTIIVPTIGSMIAPNYQAQYICHCGTSCRTKSSF